MGKQRFLAGALAVAMALSFMGLLSQANASDAPVQSESQTIEVYSGAVYCFQSGQFTTDPAAELTGLCITSVPDAAQGQILLGSRVICPGDFLTAGQLNNMTFKALSPESQEAQVTYLPIYGTRVEKEAVMTISIRKTENQPPVVKDSSFETYKNLAKEGKLEATDPEGKPLTYTLVEKPKRGDVTLGEDGTFIYTPKKNKVGKDSFTFTVTDPEGAVSQEAVVEIEILKPLDSSTYKDVTTGQFEALWMKYEGLFSGTKVAGEACFGPEKTVTRGDFLAMVMKLLDVPLDEALMTSGFTDEAEAAQWLRPYLATAMRLGLVSGNQEAGKVVFRPNDPITGAEAAVMLDNILMLPGDDTVETSAPQWAKDAAEAMAVAGIPLTGGSENLTRLEAAKILYAVSKVAESAPGMEVFRQEP